MSERTLEEIYAGIRAQKLNEEEEKKCSECGGKLDDDGDCPKCDDDGDGEKGEKKEKKDDEGEQKDESLQLEALDPAKLNKLQLITKLQPMVKFSEKFLKKMDEGSLRTILTAVLTMGLPRIQKDLAGEFNEE